jgi:hypothetical protein
MSLGSPVCRLRLGPVNILCHREEKAFNEDPNLNLSAFIPPPVSAPPPDAVLQGGELLELGAHYFKVLHTPGHSPGASRCGAPSRGLPSSATRSSPARSAGSTSPRATRQPCVDRCTNS